MDVVLEHIPSLELERKLDGLHHCKLVLGLDGQLGHRPFLVHRHIGFEELIDKLGQHYKNQLLHLDIFRSLKQLVILSMNMKHSICFKTYTAAWP